MTMRNDDGSPMTDQDRADHWEEIDLTWRRDHHQCVLCAEYVCVGHRPCGGSVQGVTIQGDAVCSGICAAIVLQQVLIDERNVPDWIEDEPTTPIPVRIDGVSYVSFKDAREGGSR